jgi:hypothetical protein
MEIVSLALKDLLVHKVLKVHKAPKAILAYKAFKV